MDEMMLAAAAGAEHRDSLSRLMASLPMPMAVAHVPPTQQMDVPGTSGAMVAPPPKREVAHGHGALPVPVPGERVPQWTPQETRDFIAIRAELERDFTVSKRNKTLWEAVAGKMREKGYRRTPEQCKCKWKNLVNRYKGKETSDPENGRQCPFFEELHAVFTERAKSMQRLLLESEQGGPRSKKKLKRISGDKSSDEFSDEDDDDGDDSEEDRTGKTKKRKVPDKERQTPRGGEKPSSRATVGTILDILQEFFQQQQRIEQQWQEMLERKAQERQAFEQEWRQSMEKLERERMIMENEWRQREEQRRIREESRAEKRDALLTTLLNRLLQEEF